jgi:hypothetical protein
MAQREHWDPKTRALIRERLHLGTERRFFRADEEPAARALLAELLALDVGADTPPVFELVDQRLADGITDGWHYDDMPPDEDAWHRSLAELVRRSFATMSRDGRRNLLESIRTGSRFAGMPARRVWDMWIRYACVAYYSHPSAWNEIGFGGPAYPRGYKNLGLDRREPWEVREVDDRDPVPWAARVEQARDAAERRRAG